MSSMLLAIVCRKILKHLSVAAVSSFHSVEMIRPTGGYSVKTERISFFVHRRDPSICSSQFIGTIRKNFRPTASKR